MKKWKSKGRLWKQNMFFPSRCGLCNVQRPVFPANVHVFDCRAEWMCRQLIHGLQSCLATYLKMKPEKKKKKKNYLDFFMLCSVGMRRITFKVHKTYITVLPSGTNRNAVSARTKQTSPGRNRGWGLEWTISQEVRLPHTCSPSFAPDYFRSFLRAVRSDGAKSGYTLHPSASRLHYFAGSVLTRNVGTDREHGSSANNV